MKDLTLTIITKDRAPRRNYLRDTLWRLEESGTFDSPFVEAVHVVDSGSANVEDYVASQVPPSLEFDTRGKLFMHTTTTPRNGRENVSAALKLAAANVKRQTPWILFCEDDVDVCDDFAGSVVRWLNDHEQDNRHVYAFGAAYDEIAYLHRRGSASSWEYPIDAFYGTQCFAIKTQDALSLARWLDEHRGTRGVDAPNAYDMMMQDWAKATWPDVNYFRASVPSFVQHRGEHSSIGNKFFEFSSWPGRSWKYVSQQSVVRL